MEKKTIKKIAEKKTKVVAKKVPKEASTKSLELNPKIWNVDYNADLVAQVLFVQKENARTGTAHAKDRSMVSGGGKKPWKQKGTGRARSGSTRSPIWVGGGVTFVPNDRNWSKKINKKMVQKAVAIMLSQRLRENAVEFVSLDSSKSLKEIRSLYVKSLGSTKSNLVIADNINVSRALSNVEEVQYSNVNNFSVLHLVGAKKIIINNEVVNMIEKRLLNEK